MVHMGCALCREKITIEHHFSEPLPNCKIHHNRVLVDWTYLEKNLNDLLIGEIIDKRYEVIRPLGEGGFGSVYYAIQQGHFRRPVAIKFLNRLSQEYIDLFIDEMRTMSRLRSPHIVQFLDSGNHHNIEIGQASPYLVMEFVEGETLAHHLIREGAQPPSRVIQIYRQLLEALIEAHRHGIVHRDIKPLNLMLSQEANKDLRLVVLDFGVARFENDATRDATRNRIMGTPYYLAPEILTNGEVTIQTDLFAASVIAYEALCFRSPFLNEELSGIEPYVKLRKLYLEEKSPLSLPPHLPEEWTKFFNVALATSPKKRFASAEIMLVALKELEERTVIKHMSIEADEFVADAHPSTQIYKKQLIKLTEHQEQRSKQNTAYGQIHQKPLSPSPKHESAELVDEKAKVKSDLITGDQFKKKGGGQIGKPTDEKALTSSPPPLPVINKPGPPPIPSAKKSPPPLPPQSKPPAIPPEKKKSPSIPPQAENSTNQSNHELFINPHKKEGRREEKIPVSHLNQFGPSTGAGRHQKSTNVDGLAEDETLHIDRHVDPQDILTIQVSGASPLQNRSFRKGKSPVRQKKSMITANGSKRIAKPKSSGLMVIFFQILLMIGLGAVFAYIVIRYILV